MKKKIYIVLLAISIIFRSTLICFADEYSLPTTHENGQNGPNIGWQYANNKWYFYDDNGIAQTGWIRDNTNSWYYLSDKGDMLTNAVTPDGYTVDETGTWIPDAKSYWNMNFSEEDVAFIDFYFVPVPAAAERKHIEDRGDISRIYRIVMNSIVDKDAAYHETSGGVYNLNFVKQDGTNIFLQMDSTSVSFMGTHYMLKKSMQLENLWENMQYDRIPISQAELPVFYAITKD